MQGQLSDTVTQVIWRAPAILQLFVGVASRVPDGGKISQTTMHAMTPETETTTHYFVLSTRDFRPDDAEFNAGIGAFVNNIFATKDKPVLEAQQAMMGTPDLWATDPVILPIDTGAIRARRILERLVADGLGSQPHRQDRADRRAVQRDRGWRDRHHLCPAAHLRTYGVRAFGMISA